MKHIPLERLFPFLSWWPLVNRTTLRADLIAGFTGAIVVLPQGVAFATIAGMPPEYGLYAAMIPAIVAALFGSSWHLVSGPTTAASIVLFSALSALAEPGSAEYVRYALTLTFMVGAIQLVMGLVRLGTLVNFISHSVILGFTAGAAILIATSQFKHFFGIEIPRGLHPHEILYHFGRQLEAVEPYVLLVGLFTLATGILVRRYARRIPYMLVAMIVGSALAATLNYLLGPETTGIVTLEALHGALPPISTPEFSLSVIKQLAPAALAATLFALTEAVSISRSLAVRSGQDIDGNQEFIGQGLSNVVGSFFSSYVATGSFNRSALNYESGAKTPLAAVLAGSLLMVIFLLIAPLAAYLPNATMAAILFLVAWGLIDFHHIQKVLKASRAESAVLGVTFFATLLLELEFAILLGVFLSLIVYLSRTSRPRIYSRVPDPRLPGRRFNTDPDLPECPQLKLVRIDGSLFFGAVSYVSEKLRGFLKEKPSQKHLLLLAQGINFVDVAGAETLVRETEKRRKIGGDLYLYRIKPGACETLMKGGYINQIGRDHTFEHKSEAIATIYSRLDPEICKRCDKRIFTECATYTPSITVYPEPQGSASQS